MGAASLIAIDWGTTSARAYRLDARGEVRDRRSSALGIARIEDRRYAEALASLLGDWQADSAPRLACGMIGSRQGWVEAPYVPCPASLNALAAQLTAVDGALSIVPGLATRDRGGMPDVMRGEETQLMGAVAANEGPVLAALPGTHSKWAYVDAGRVVDFATYMTGELYAILLDHSLLGRMARRESQSPLGAAFERGAGRGLRGGAFAHDVFGARTLALHGELAPDETAEWLSGLLIGRELHDARHWARERGFDAARVRIVGSDTLCQRYATALALAGVASERGDADAAALGLWRIADQAGLLH